MIGKLVISVAKDMMKAQATIVNKGTDNITIGYVEDQLKDLGVKAGIDNEAIKRLVEWEQYDKTYTVAVGQDPGITKPGYYDWLFDTEVDHNHAPSIREDGTVDYSIKRVTATKGEVLGVYHPPITGKFGYTVYATMIAPKPQPEYKVLAGEGVQVDGDRFIATESGEIFLSETRIKIENTVTIQGDAKYGMGTTDFVGDVHVTGDVNSGVEIKAGGNVIIDGIVEAATIVAGNDIVIRGGVHGRGKANLNAKGSVFATFIEESKVKAGKNIHINSMINSEAYAYGAIIAEGKRASIIGGKSTAGKEIFTDYIGNEAEVPTIVEIVSEDLERLPNFRIAVRRTIHPKCEIFFNNVRYKGAKDISGEYHLEGEEVRYYKMGTYVEKVIVPKPVEKPKPLVMLVDDEPMILKTFFGFIAEKYRVMIAANPKDALNQLEGQVPDLMLLDYKMPIMDGGQLLETIRKSTDKPYCHVPVIFATAMSDKDIVKKCLSLYPQGYLVKPLTKDELLDVLDKFFDDSVDTKFLTKQG